MKKILFVEDEKVLMEMYKEKFTEAGYKVVSVFSAEEGLGSVRKEKPDLIMLDILLPRTNGIAFLRKIKADPELAKIPVIVFSNFDDPQAKKEALSLGVLAYLIKTNYTPQQVIDKVKEYLK